MNSFVWFLLSNFKEIDRPIHFPPFRHNRIKSNRIEQQPKKKKKKSNKIKGKTPAERPRLRLESPPQLKHFLLATIHFNSI